MQSMTWFHLWINNLQNSLSHADNGIHILKCTICHAVDLMTPSLLSSTGRVCKYNEEVVLVVSSGVHASMKGINFDLTIAVTEKDLIAAYCACKRDQMLFSISKHFLLSKLTTDVALTWRQCCSHVKWLIISSIKLFSSLFIHSA